MKCNYEKAISNVQNRKEFICEGGILIIEQILQQINENMDKVKIPREKQALNCLKFMDSLRKVKKDLIIDMGVDDRTVKEIELRVKEASK